MGLLIGRHTSHITKMENQPGVMKQHYFVDGKHVCSISEERLTRRKHDGNYPINSIDYCLSAGNITAEDVDLVCVPSMCVSIFYKKLYSGVIEGMVGRSSLRRVQTGITPPE